MPSARKPPAVIALLHRKGGVGKTTLATNLARAFQLGGLETVIVDTDPQGTARDWAAAQEDVQVPMTVGVDRPTLEREVPRIAADLVIIDGAAKVARLTISALKAADLVLIPVQPSAFDAWAAEEVLDLVRERQEIAGKPDAYFVVSRQIRGSKLAKTAPDAFKDLGLEVLPGTSQRIVYAEAGGRGLSVLDVEPDGKAADEIRALTHALAERLGLTITL